MKLITKTVLAAASLVALSAPAFAGTMAASPAAKPAATTAAARPTATVRSNRATPARHVAVKKVAKPAAARH